MKTLHDIDTGEKKVLVRVDFNVPLSGGRVADDTRIRSVLPTLGHLLQRRDRIVLASHLGRPKGKVVAELSLAPVAGRLSEMLGLAVRTAPDCVGDSVAGLVDALKPGEMLLLENLRFHPEEEKNDPEFARSLARLCEVYVNDAFAVSHRANASVEAVTRYSGACAAGFLMAKELETFDRALTHPQRPLAAIVGGAKVSSKIGALENLLQRVDKLLIGGAMANTFLRSRGIDVGASKVEQDMIGTAEAVLRKAEEKGVLVYLPVDVVTSERLEPGAATRTVTVEEIPAGSMALDIGPATAALFSEALHDVATIVWNGPMGVFEMEPFSEGTFSLARSVAGSGAFSIVGGGDTDAAVHRAGVTDRIGYISTGGGAFLQLLEGRSLPGVQALLRCQGETE